MKIFKMNDFDWVAAENLEDAKQALANTLNDGTVGAEFEEEFLDHPGELDDSELDRLKFVDEDNRDAEGNIIRITFREQLNKMISEGQKFPCHFASSEY